MVFRRIIPYWILNNLTEGRGRDEVMDKHEQGWGQCAAHAQWSLQNLLVAVVDNDIRHQIGRVWSDLAVKHPSVSMRWFWDLVDVKTLPLKGWASKNWVKSDQGINIYCPLKSQWELPHISAIVPTLPWWTISALFWAKIIPPPLPSSPFPSSLPPPLFPSFISSTSLHPSLP